MNQNNDGISTSKVSCGGGDFDEGVDIDSRKIKII